jgi:uncharacterized protein YijF (DUF1287 family)
MASISFQITLVGGTQMTKTAAVSDTDAGRLVAWALATMPTELDAQGQQIAKDGPWAVGRWIESVISETFAKVHAHEVQKASDMAAAAVQQIAVTVS